ncbi:hypothetical protein Tco_1147152, partial [Tanacetum coccineum]
VKGIGRVSLMKSKVTSKGDSPRSRWVSRSERDKESDKAPVVAVGADKLSDLVKDKANAVKDKVKDTDVDAVNDKALDVVTEKRKTELSKDKPKDKAPPVVKSKVPTELPKENAKDKSTVDVVNDKALDVLVVNVVKDKPEVVKLVVDVTDKSVVDVVKDNAPMVVKEKCKTKLLKDKPKVRRRLLLRKDKHKADLRKGKPKPKDTHNVISEVPVLRSKSKYHSKKNVEVKMVKGKMDIEYSDSGLESDEVDIDSSSDVVSDRKAKKRKRKVKLKRKSKGGSDSNSSSVDKVKVRRMLKKLKKIKKEDSDEDSGLKSKKKCNKKEKQLTPAEAAHEKYQSCFPTMRARTVSSSLFSAIREASVDMWSFFVRNRVAGLRGQICLDVVRRLREDCDIFKIDWRGYIYSCLENNELPKKKNRAIPWSIYIPHYSTKFDRFPVIRTHPTIRDWTSTLIRQRHDLETKEHVIGCLDPHDALFKKAKEKLATICSERVFLEDLIRKASSDYPGDGKFVELQEKYVHVFRDPISFDVDVSSVDGGNDSDGDDDNDQGNVDEDLNVKDPSGSNSSFGFSKISLDDFEKQPYVSGKGAKNGVDLVEGAKTQVIEKELVDPTVQETVVEEILLE